jgi:hypothetical protein
MIERIIFQAPAKFEAVDFRKRIIQQNQIGLKKETLA